MKFVDEVYAMYRHHLDGLEDNALALIMELFLDHSREDLLKFIQEMNDEEVLQMVTLYLYQMLRLKMMRDEDESSGGSIRYH